MASSSSSPLSPPVFHVLLALSEGPLHGYAIMQRAESASGATMGPGTIYGSLRRLADAGWVEELEGPEARQGDARRGRSFALTPAGADALAGEARRITRLAEMDGVRRLATEGS